jgi:hypothetical protein
MKKHSHLFIFLLLFTGVFFSECKKYPEDDVFIQWRRPEKRLIKYGPWVFDKLTVDGVDKSEEFRADSAYFDRLEFYHTEENLQIININRFDNRFDEPGRYKLIDKNKTLSLRALTTYLNGSDYKNYGPIFSSQEVNWEILKLSKNGLTLKVIYNSSEFILRLTTLN